MKTSRTLIRWFTRTAERHAVQRINNYLTENKCVQSMSHPGHPWDNSPMEHWWNNFKHIWMDHHPDVLETLIQGAIDYVNRKRAYTSKNGLTAGQFRNQAVSC